jgi:hypothetical protein
VLIGRLEVEADEMWSFVQQFPVAYHIELVASFENHSNLLS